MADSTSLSSSNENQNAMVTTITDLNVDSLAHSAAYLNLQDVCNLAMTCRYLKRVAYSDSIWHRFFWEHWLQSLSSSSLPSCGVREMYLARRTAVQQFKFGDPSVANFYTDVEPFKHLQLSGNDIFLTRGSLIEMINMDRYQSGKDFASTLNDHKARITCMRLFSVNDISFLRGKTEREQKVLVTSSCDHSIRLWWKGSCQKCFRGHSGPVLSLSNKLLGEDNSKILASGGEDGTVRLWSLSSSGKRGQQALKATLYGHEKPVNLMSVAGHKTSLLATVSRDSKLRVWDTATSSAVRSSCCVGMTSVTGAPINLKCHESLLYIASGSSITAVDLRTMQKVITAAVHLPKLYSFDIVPSKSLFCTGGYGRAMLWDIRRNQAEPIAELDGHCGPVTLLHMDPYKIVSGGHEDTYINVWEVDTGAQTNSLSCCCIEKDGHSNSSGCVAMAVDGSRIATASHCGENGIVRFRDFNNGSSPVMKLEDEEHSSKFWDSSTDGNSSDWHS
ncbi:putative E3 ubiquitin ligase complex SCF subunit sconB [Senna tora]|uniref:Putative E3 ubiquitin ligase complex SCF subunit sconB n=1 Tax=Senna tora TaxID=362788 RepID=A0A834WHL4_9FABA|nr:putative E3 ubiquitin ligase complex SCF subunit sconB [Senna tora]